MKIGYDDEDIAALITYEDSSIDSTKLTFITIDTLLMKIAALINNSSYEDSSIDKLLIL